jgi:hypothetical protein
MPHMIELVRPPARRGPRGKLNAMELGVNAVARDQVRMSAVFDNAPGIEHRDAVDAFDGG